MLIFTVVSLAMIMSKQQAAGITQAPSKARSFAILEAVVTTAFLSTAEAAFSPKWTTPERETSGEMAIKQVGEDGSAFVETKQSQCRGEGGTMGRDGTCSGGSSGGAEHARLDQMLVERFDHDLVPLPPPYSEKLFLSKSGSGPSSSDAATLADFDASATSLHLPPRATFRHGETLGMTILARRSDGEMLPLAGLEFSISLLGSGDSHTGTVFDLQNGTYFVYTTIFFSPTLDFDAGSVSMSVMHGGQHIAGSPVAVPLDFAVIRSDYQRRLDAARGLEEHDACLRDFVLVSGSNAAMFDRLVNLVGSFHVWEPGTRVILYDLGLSPAQAADVLTWEHVEYRSFPFGGYPPHVKSMGENGSYAWRGPILVNVSHEHECSLWLDAGLELRSAIAEIKGLIARDGHFYVTNGWPSPNRFTHPSVVSAVGIAQADFFTNGGKR